MLIFVVYFVLCSLTLDVKASYNSEEISSNELPCLSYGGICVRSDDCPEDKRSDVKGLCPLQQTANVECCHALPISETRCRKRGGECFPQSYQCPEIYTYNKATDCADNELCCILVK